jgi:hypothetical protein
MDADATTTMTEERRRYRFRLSATDFTCVCPRKIRALKNFNANPARVTAVPDRSRVLARMLPLRALPHGSQRSTIVC